MNTTLKWLLAGTGDIAEKRVAPALAGTAGSKLYAVCDLDRTRAEDFALRFGVGAVYDNYETALTDSGIDAVYIATPVWLHVPMAVKALEAGKHVLVEKPLGLDAGDAEKALNIAESSNLVAGCAYFRRFYPAYSLVETMIANGEFGDIVLVRMAYYSWFDPTPEDRKYWRVERTRSGGGPLADMGSHMFDVLIGLLGMPARVFASAPTLERSWNVEDSSAFVMTLPGGAPVTGSFHWNSKTWLHMFEIVGTEARVLMQPFDSGKIIRTVGRDTVEIDVPLPANVHAPLIEDFIAAVKSGGSPKVTLSGALKTNRLLDAVYRASDERREVKV